MRRPFGTRLEVYILQSDRSVYFLHCLYLIRSYVQKMIRNTSGNHNDACLGTAESTGC
jgi:hypothetical protein